MRIDVSSDSFDRVRDYTRVVLQQGRPILDRDWNEQTAIVLNHLRAVARAVYGRHGGPAGGACGFVPYESKDGSLWLRKGQYTIDGQLFECDRDYPYAEQKYWKPGELEKGKILFVYLEAMEREVTAAEEPGLLDTALPGVDVAARGQAVWRVLHCDWSSRVDITSETFCKDAVVEASKWSKERLREQESPSEVLAVGDCVELQGALKNRINQLLRLECHEANPNGGRSVWKFSADNGFALFKIARIADDRKAVTVDLGNLKSWKPAGLDIVEFLTLKELRFNHPGELNQVVNTPFNNEQSLESANHGVLSLRDPVSKKVSQGDFLRAWHRTFVLPSFPQLRDGDYWQQPVRDTEPDLSSLSIKRPTRHYVPLALVKTTEDEAKVKILARFQRVVGVPWREVDEIVDGLVADSSDDSGLASV